MTSMIMTIGKTISLVTLSVLLVSKPLMNDILDSEIPTLSISHHTIPEPVIVLATMYHPVEEQCDSSPSVLADGTKIDISRASQYNYIAMSRDLLSRWGGEFNYGDMVEVSGAGHKDGIYTIRDTMNRRFTMRIDFLETPDTPQYRYSEVVIRRVQ